MSILPGDFAEGEAHRDAALSLLQARRPELIRTLQAAALRVALERGEVTADDVRAAVPIPDGVRPVVMGAVFRPLALAGYLRHNGYRRSTRPVTHARPLAVWRLADVAGAAAWLASRSPPNV